MKAIRNLALISLGATACIVAAASSARQEITAVQIADAVSRTGMPVAPERVVLLSHVTSGGAEPMLKVESMQPIAGGDLRVRVACENHPDCLPFYVVVKSSAAAPERARATLQASVAPAWTSSDKAKEQSSPVAIRSGAPAMLFIDDGRVHIRVAVVSLENGSLGHLIRVVSRDRKTTYTAEVETTTTLRGQL